MDWFHPQMKKPSFEHNSLTWYNDTPEGVTLSETVLKQAGIHVKLFHCISPEFYTYIKAGKFSQKMVSKILCILSR